MSDTNTYANILRKTDPFVLSTTVQNLDNIAPNPAFALPLGATPASGETDQDRPYLQTPFNKLDKGNYRSPWKESSVARDTDILQLEQTANEVWDAYRQLYYGSDAVGSVFVRPKGSDVRTGTPSKAKTKKDGALEALFGIQKKCFGESNNNNNGTGEIEIEIARWDSVHTVIIEPPNFDDGTCEYKIKSAVWCWYKPEDVGDIPKAQRSKPATPPKKKDTSPKKPNSKLDVARLEVFDSAANNWDTKSNHNKAGTGDAADFSKGGKPLPPVPVPAVVTSSAVYTKDTARVCKLQVTKKQTKAIPVASHIQNIGTLLEKIEADFRSKLERVDAPKCVEVLQGMYRPSLSPGLKLPNNSSNSKTSGSMISKLGGHATGMGVGKGLIGEIALKAKAKGLGNEAASTTNKAMENILANEKKKLKDLDDTGSPSKAPTTWNQTGLKKSKVSPNNKIAPGANTFEKPNLRKTNSTSASVQAPTEGSGPAFLKRSQLRKAVSARVTEPSTPAPTPEFMNFRSKLKSTAAK